MNYELYGITFQAWHYRFFFFVVLLFISVACIRFRNKQRALALLTYSPILIHFYSPFKQILKIILLSCGLILLWIALMRPSWGVTDQKVEQEGRDVLIILDVSRSMLAQDVKPNRLEFAKRKIQDIVRKLDCDRVGLMLFSGSSVVQCPLTRDYAAFFLFLKEVDAEVISSGTTSIDQALRKAIELFEAFKERKHKVVVALTDGEDFSSNLAGIKAKAIAQGITIFTLGVGSTEGAPIPLYDKRGNQIGHQKDAQSNIVISKLNEGILKALSHESGGMYFHARESNQDVEQLMHQVQKYEREKFQEHTISNVIDRYPYFALGAFIFLLCEWML